MSSAHNMQMFKHNSGFLVLVRLFLVTTTHLWMTAPLQTSYF